MAATAAAVLSPTFLRMHRPRAGQLLLLKVPNIIKVDPLPYDPEQTDIEPEVIDEGGKKKVRPNDINVIRWRYRCVAAVCVPVC